MNDYRRIAYNYFDNNLAVLPVTDKRCTVRKRYELSDKEILEHYLWQKANGLGIICGSRTGVIVLDIDITNDSTLEHRKLRDDLIAMMPPALVSRTGNPEKPASVFFRYNGEKTMHFESCKVDVLSTGSYCVLPPSVHPDCDVNFKWVNSELLDIDIDDLPYLPSGVVDVLSQHEDAFKKESKESGASKLTKSAGRCKHGSNIALSWYLTKLHRLGKDRDFIVNEILRYDKNINWDADYYYFNCPKRKEHQGVSEREAAEAFVDRRFEYKPDEHGVDGDNAIDPELVANGFYFDKQTDTGVTQVPMYSEMADHFKAALKFKCDDTYKAIYDNGYYRFVTNNFLNNKILDLTKGKLKPQHLRNFTTMIGANCYHPQRDLVAPEGLLNLKNGVLDVSNMSLLDHSSDYGFTYKLQHNFNPDAPKPVNFLKAIKTTTGGDIELGLLLQEIFGYCIEGGLPKAQKAFVFSGEGSNGKSTILTALRTLLGDENVSNVPINLLDKPFSVVSMHGKIANIVDETPKGGLNAEAFKNIVTGGSVQAAYKGKDEFSVKLRCKMVFACNTPPNFGDSTDGLRRRLVVIPFKQKITEAAADRDIDGKIASEMSGILNWALAGLVRLKRNGYRFTIGKAVNDMTEEYKRETDSVYDFLTQYAEWSPLGSCFTTTDEAYGLYIAFCKRSGFRYCSKISFAKRAGTVYEKMYLAQGVKLLNKNKVTKVKGKQFRGIQHIFIAKMDINTALSVTF